MIDKTAEYKIIIKIECLIFKALHFVCLLT
jgi:hypothetical protein